MILKKRSALKERTFLYFSVLTRISRGGDFRHLNPHDGRRGDPHF